MAAELQETMLKIEEAFDIFDPHDLFIISFKDRLLSKTRVDKNGCWIWTGALDWTGYGIIGIKLNDKYRLLAVHRLSAHLFLGLDLTQQHIKALHKNECNRRNCWNYEHLYLGTQQDNVRDAINSGKHRNVRNKKSPK